MMQSMGELLRPQELRYKLCSAVPMGPSGYYLGMPVVPKLSVDCPGLRWLRQSASFY